MIITRGGESQKRSELGDYSLKHRWSEKVSRGLTLSHMIDDSFVWRLCEFTT